MIMKWNYGNWARFRVYAPGANNRRAVFTLPVSYDARVEIIFSAFIALPPSCRGSSRLVYDDECGFQWWNFFFYIFAIS